MGEGETRIPSIYISIYAIQPYASVQDSCPVARERNLSCPIMGSQKEIHTYIIGLGLRPIWPMNESMG